MWILHQDGKTITNTDNLVTISKSDTNSATKVYNIDFYYNVDDNSYYSETYTAENERDIAFAKIFQALEYQEITLKL